MRFFILFLVFTITTTVFSQGINLATPPGLENKTASLVKTVTFYAKDSVKITADTYFLKGVQPTVLLCHQAGFSRGEYIDTAKKLNALGFSCMAIDQRSGNAVNDIINQTAVDAKIKGVNVGYAGAKKDIDAAIDYLYNSNGNKPIILVGSSYSASLALWIASENKKIKAVAAFSPGEYLKNKNLAETIKSIAIPTFVTSSQRETSSVEKLLRFVKSSFVIHFKPTVKGIHGSRALWDITEGHEGYWEAFKAFLITNK